MESLLFVLDAAAIVVIVFFSLKNDLLRAGTQQIGPFRIADDGPAKPAPPGRGRLPARPARRAP